MKVLLVFLGFEYLLIHTWNDFVICGMNQTLRVLKEKDRFFYFFPLLRVLLKKKLQNLLRTSLRANIGVDIEQHTGEFGEIPTVINKVVG